MAQEKNKIHRAIHRTIGVGIAAALAVAVGIAYGPVLNHGFIAFDDNVYVTENPRVRAGLTLGGLTWAATTTHFSYWHPVTWLSHMVDAAIYGLNPSGHHLSSLILHGINALLLLFLFWRMTGELLPSSLVAGLFALHPLNVESVAWISERKNVLNMLFWLLTIWGYVRYTEQPGRARYGIALTGFVLGLMTKPMIVTLPVVLLLLDFWPLGRLSTGMQGLQLSQLRLVLVEKIPFVALSMVSSAVTLWGQARIGALRPFDAYPVGVRIGNALHAYVNYLLKLFWPVRLSAFYSHPEHSLPLWKMLGAAAILGIISALVVGRSRRAPYALAGWCWYLLTLVPVIGLIQVGSQAGADRYMYIPAIGIFVMVAWGLVHGLGKTAFRRSVAACAAGLVLVAYTSASRQQAAHWRTSETLFTHMLRVSPGNYLAHNGLGLTLARRGKTAEAVGYFREALRLKPDYSRAYNNLGNALGAQGETAEAIESYEKAIGHDPRNAKAHNNLAAALAAKGDLATAAAHFSEAVRIYPDYVRARRNLAQALAALGDAAGARYQETEADRIDRGGSR